jgi:hypothetical protein
MSRCLTSSLSPVLITLILVAEPTAACLVTVVELAGLFPRAHEVAAKSISRLSRAVIT